MQSILKSPQKQRKIYRFLRRLGFGENLLNYSVLSAIIRPKKQRASKMILTKKAAKRLTQQAGMAFAVQ